MTFNRTYRWQLGIDSFGSGSEEYVLHLFVPIASSSAISFQSLCPVPDLSPSASSAKKHQRAHTSFVFFCSVLYASQSMTFASSLSSASVRSLRPKLSSNSRSSHQYWLPTLRCDAVSIDFESTGFFCTHYFVQYLLYIYRHSHLFYVLRRIIGARTFLIFFCPAPSYNTALGRTGNQRTSSLATVRSNVRCGSDRDNIWRLL